MVVLSSGFHPLLGNDAINVTTSTSANGVFTNLNTTNLTSTNSTLGTIIGTSSTISGDSTTNNLNVSGNATVTGNLNVNGTTTFLNTSNVDIKDALVRLGKTTDATVNSLYIAGLEFDRGTSNNLFQITYHESDQLIKAGQPNSLLPLMLREISPSHNNVVFWDGTALKAITKNAVDTRTLIDTYSKGETNTLLLGKSDTTHTHDDRYYTETESDNKYVDKTSIQTISGTKTFTSVIKTDQVEPNTGNLHLSSLVVYPNDKASLGTNIEPYQQFEIHGTAQQVGMNFHNGVSDNKYSLGMYDNDFYLVSGENLGLQRLLKINSSITDVITPFKLSGISQSLLGKILFYDATTKNVNYHDANTTNIIEGSNQYFTIQRARTALSAGTGISYNNSTGVISSTVDVSNVVQYTNSLKDIHQTASNNIHRVSQISLQKQIAFNSAVMTDTNYFDATDPNRGLWWSHRIYTNNNLLKFNGYGTGEQHFISCNNTDGNIGMGTDTPTQKLDVNGNIKATQINTTTIHSDGQVIIRSTGANSIFLQPNQQTVLSLPASQFPIFYKPIQFSYNSNSGSFPVIYKTEDFTNAFDKYIILDNATFKTHTIRFNGYLSHYEGTDTRGSLDVQFYYFNTSTNAWVIQPLESNSFVLARGSTFWSDTDASSTLRLSNFIDENYDISLKLTISPKMISRQQVNFKASYTYGNIGATQSTGSCHPTDGQTIGRIRILSVSQPNAFSQYINGRVSVEGKDVISLNMA